MGRWRCGAEQVVRALVESGANVHARSQVGTSTLHLAAAHADLEVVRLMVDAGASLCAVEAMQGNAPLHTAAQEGRADVVSHTQ